MEDYFCFVFGFKVSVDIFKGFPDEDSIVNYTLNQAYHDNVSVFASECGCHYKVNSSYHCISL